jgi:hypothetical protein
MTKDFRDVGRIPVRTSSATAAQDNVAVRHRNVVIASIRFAAVLFFLAGVWLLGGGSSPVPAEVSTYLGFALIASAMADIAVVAILKRNWSKMDARIKGNLSS